MVPAPRLGLTERAALEARWLDLTRRVLPGLAAEREWPIHADHCFQRALLDAVFDGVWYAHVPTRPAYRAMSDAALTRAVALADGVVDGTVDLRAIDVSSKRLRGSR